MIMKFTASCALLLAAAFDPAAQAQTKAPAMSATLRPGLWEVSIAEQAVNSTSKRTTVSRLCLTPEDVKLPEHVIPAQRAFGMHCENLDAKVDGATIAWKVVCKGKAGSSIGSASMTSAADGYTAQVKLDSRLGAKAAKVEQTITGKRLGDCK